MRDIDETAIPAPGTRVAADNSDHAFILATAVPADCHYRDFSMFAAIGLARSSARR
jgi:hypothetical protein